MHLIDLAEHGGQQYLPMKEVASRQEISLKYLERILPLLTKSGYVEGQHGKGGGYRLKKTPQDIRVGDVLRLTEGDLAPVACLIPGADPCNFAHECRTLEMWKEYFRLTNTFFDGITIADLMKTSYDSDYII